MLTRLLCPPLSPSVCSNSCLMSRWAKHLILCPLFSFSHQSFPASGSFPMNWVFTSRDQSIGASASASVLPMNIQGWFPLRLMDLISLQSKELSSLLQHHNSKAPVLWCSVFFMVQLSNPYMKNHTGKTIALTTWIFVYKVMFLLFNMVSKFVIAFLPRSKHLLISWQQSPSAVILEPEKIKCITASTFSPSVCHKVTALDAMIFIFWMFSFKPAFSLSSFTLIKKLFSSSSLSAIRVVLSAYFRL